MSIPKIENLTKALPSSSTNTTDGKASIKDIKESPTETGIPLYQITLNGSSKIFNGVGVAFSKGIPDLKPEDLVKNLQALSSDIANGKTEKVQEALEKLPGAVLTYSKDGNNLIAYSDKGEAIGFSGRVGKLHEADNPLIKGFDTLKAVNNNKESKSSDTFSSSGETLKPPTPKKLA